MRECEERAKYAYARLYALIFSRDTRFFVPYLLPSSTFFFPLFFFLFFFIFLLLARVFLRNNRFSRVVSGDAAGAWGIDEGRFTS